LHTTGTVVPLLVCCIFGGQRSLCLASCLWRVGPDGQLYVVLNAQQLFEVVVVSRVLSEVVLTQSLRRSTPRFVRQKNHQEIFQLGLAT
jgi:hypothetical protein